MHVSAEGSDQGWHLDGTDHGNTQATVRDLLPRQVMMFYYPGGATRDMGPTAVVRGSHYYNIDGEGKRQSEDNLGALDDPRFRFDIYRPIGTENSSARWQYGPRAGCAVNLVLGKSRRSGIIF
jgi:hypothetical protein